MLSTLLISLASSKPTLVDAEGFRQLFSDRDQNALVHLFDTSSHDESLNTIFEGMAIDAKNLGHPTHFLNIDLSDDKEGIFKEMKMQSAPVRIPGVAYVREGMIEHEYEGPFEARSLIRYVNDMSSNKIAYFGTREEMVEQKDAQPDIKDRIIIAYQGSLKPGDAEFQIFKGLADIMRYWGKFVCFPHPDGKIDMPNIEVIRTDGTFTRTPFDQQVQVLQLINFIRGESLGYLDHYDALTTYMYEGAPFDTIYVIKNDEDEISESMINAAKSMRGRLAMRSISTADALDYFSDESLKDVSFGTVILKQKGKTSTQHKIQQVSFDDDILSQFKSLMDYNWANDAKTFADDEL